MNSLLQRLLNWWARWWPRRRPLTPAAAIPAAAPVPALPAPPKACATVVIPALNEAARIGDVVRYAWAVSYTHLQATAAGGPVVDAPQGAELRPVHAGAGAAFGEEGGDVETDAAGADDRHARTHRVAVPQQVAVVDDHRMGCLLYTSRCV